MDRNSRNNLAEGKEDQYNVSRTISTMGEWNNKSSTNTMYIVCKLFACNKRRGTKKNRNRKDNS